MIAAILASFNESNNPIFWDNLQLLRSEVEVVLVVDGGSRDGTVERVQHMGIKTVVQISANRAKRYNLGLQSVTAEQVLLVHPRTRLTRDALLALASQEGFIYWGAFTHQFDDGHWLLRFTSWYSNHIRGGLRGIYYLDHCLFLSRDLAAHVRFPEVDLFEDTGFSLRLRAQSWPRRLPTPVITSAVRFRRNGLWRQALMNQVLKLLYHLGVSAERMNRIYERGLGLNPVAAACVPSRHEVPPQSRSDSVKDCGRDKEPRNEG